MRTVIANFKIKHKCKTMLRVIRNLILDFILCVVTAYTIKYSTHATSAQGTAQNTL